MPVAQRHKVDKYQVPVILLAPLKIIHNEHGSKSFLSLFFYSNKFMLTLSNYIFLCSWFKSHFRRYKIEHKQYPDKVEFTVHSRKITEIKYNFIYDVIYLHRICAYT